MEKFDYFTKPFTFLVKVDREGIKTKISEFLTIMIFTLG